MLMYSLDNKHFVSMIMVMWNKGTLLEMSVIWTVIYHTLNTKMQQIVFTVSNYSLHGIVGILANRV